MKLILKDKTELELTDITAHDLIFQCADVTAFMGIWSALNPENLSELTVMDGEETVQVLSGVSLTGTQTVINSDGSMTAHFYFDGARVSKESDYEQAGRILIGEVGEGEDIVGKAEKLKSTLDALKA